MERSESGKPRVTVFGEPVRTEAKTTAPRERRVRQHGDHTEGVVWGVFLILGGGVLLLNTLVIVPWSFWESVWRFWPILLVLAGLEIILGKSAFSRAVLFVLTLAILAFVCAYGLADIGSPLTDSYPPELQSAVERVQLFIR